KTSPVAAKSLPVFRDEPTGRHALSPRMKIVTYNLNGIRARLPRLLEYLQEQEPDVVCLQELKCAEENLPLTEISAAGYAGVWHGQKGFNGVAILSRSDHPLTL